MTRTDAILFLAGTPMPPDLTEAETEEYLDTQIEAFEALRVPREELAAVIRAFWPRRAES